MAVIGASSLVFAAGLTLAFLVAPRADSILVMDAGLVLIALGFAGLIGAVASLANPPPAPPPRRTPPPDRHTQRPRTH